MKHVKQKCIWVKDRVQKIAKNLKVGQGESEAHKDANKMVGGVQGEEENTVRDKS